MTVVLPSDEDIVKLREWRDALLAGDIDEGTPPPVDFHPLRIHSMDIDLSKFSEEIDFDVPIIKTDDDKRLAFGWASVAKNADGSLPYDSDGDEIHKIEDMEEAAYDFVVNSRVGGVMHVRKGVADLVESVVFTPDKLEKMGLPENSLPTAWWVGFRINDEEVWQGVKSNKYNMFSVHGRGVRKELED